MIRRILPVLVALTWPALAAAQVAEPEPSALERKLESTKVTVQFLSTPVRDALAYLSRTGDVNVVLAQDADPDAAVTFRAKDMPLGRVIHWVTYLAGLSYRIEENSVRIATKGEIDSLRAVLETFDVRDLTLGAPDLPGPRLAFGEHESGAPLVFGTTGDAGLSLDRLVELVDKTIARGTWDTPPNHLRGERGVIFARHQPETIEAIRRFLADLRAHAARMVVVEGVLYRVSDADWAARLGDGAGVTGFVFDREAWGAMRTALEASEGVHVLAALRTTGAPGQEVHAVSLSTASYLADFDALIAQGSVVAEPIMGLARDGAVLDVRPTPSADGRSVVVRLRFESVTRSFDRTAPFETLRIVLPEASGVRVETSVRIPEGGAYVQTLTHPVAGPGARLVLAVEPRLVSSEEGNR